MVFVLDSSAYDLLVAEQAALPAALLALLPDAIRVLAGYRFACSWEMSLELAAWFLEHGRRNRQERAVYDVCIRAAATIGRGPRYSA